MPRIPDDLVERVKHEISIVRLIERDGVVFKRVGTNLIAHCPGHDDKTPSLVVTEEKNLWHDLGACQRGGSTIDWVMWREDLGFYEATRKLAEEFFPEEAARVFAASRSRRFTAESLPCPIEEGADDAELDRQVVTYYHECGKHTPAFLDFLTKRAIVSAEMIERYQIGFANRTLGTRLSAKLKKRCQERGWFRKDTGHEHLSGSMTLGIPGAHGEVLNCYGRKITPNLRPGTPDHLYLARPLRGVLNLEAFTASSEIVLCEAPIDFLSAWGKGFRNSTCTWGAENFTNDHLEAFVANGVERCLIAFDRDEAGDKGAADVAQKLSAAGVACYRVLFPKGMDLNDVVVKMHPAEKTLALFFRSAEYMCGGNGSRVNVHVAAPHITNVTAPTTGGNGNGHHGPLAIAAAATIESLAEAAKKNGAAETHELALETTSTSASPEIAAEKGSTAGSALDTSAPHELDERGATTSPATSPEASPTASPSETTAKPSRVSRFAQARPDSAPLAKATEPAKPALQAAPAPLKPPKDGFLSATDDEARFLFGARRYRARGLRRNSSFGVLKVNLMATREGDFFEGSPLTGLHADTFDLYLSRSRALFERDAARELGVKDEVVKRDLCAVLKKLEDLQAEAIERERQPKVKKVLLTEKDTEEALAFWKAPNLLSRIVSDVTRCGLVGEETNKLVTYIAACSRLLPRPLAVVIQSSSAAGKTSLMEAILNLMPEEAREKYTAMSGRSLFYFEDVSLKHKVLAIVEEEGAERASYPLKILQSEGELVMASTGKDPHTGKLVTQIYRVEGPVMIILTTTSYDLDPELENRCIKLTVDESREQTRRIHELQRRAQTLEGLLARKDEERITKLHRNAQRLLRPLYVLNPYERELTFVDDQTRTRRDHEKYLTLIGTIALMHQHQRSIKHVVVNAETREVVECVEVTLDDVQAANRLAGEVFGRTLDELHAQTRRFLAMLREKVKAICEEQGVEQRDLRFTRWDVREWTGWSDFQVRVHLGRLVELEYVLSHHGARGQSYVYELLYRGEGQTGQPFVLGLVDVEKLRAKLANEASAAVPAATTTETSRGQEAGFEGSSSPRRGAIEGASSTAPAPPEPAQEAVLSAPETKTAENALIPPPAEACRTHTRSYPLKPFRRGIKLNLLRFPPGSLVRAAERRELAPQPRA